MLSYRLDEACFRVQTKNDWGGDVPVSGLADGAGVQRVRGCEGMFTNGPPPRCGLGPRARRERHGTRRRAQGIHGRSRDAEVPADSGSGRAPSEAPRAPSLPME
jgi:hypothetical protein